MDPDTLSPSTATSPSDPQPRFGEAAIIEVIGHDSKPLSEKDLTTYKAQHDAEHHVSANELGKSTIPISAIGSIDAATLPRQEDDDDSHPTHLINIAKSENDENLHSECIVADGDAVVEDTIDIVEHKKQHPLLTTACATTIDLTIEESDPPPVQSNSRRELFFCYPIVKTPVNPIEVFADDLARVRDNDWLNDSVLDLKTRVFMESFEDVEKISNIFVYSGLFYGGFREAINLQRDLQVLPNWTKNVDIFAMDFVFIPMSYNCHWSLCVGVRLGQWLSDTYDTSSTKNRVDDEGKNLGCLLFVDSLNAFHSYQDDAKLIKLYLSAEWKKCKKYNMEWRNRDKTFMDCTLESNPNLNLFCDIQSVKCSSPKQHNGYDCALFVTKAIEVMIRTPPNTTQSDLDTSLRNYFNTQSFSQDDITQDRQDLLTAFYGLHERWLGLNHRLDFTNNNQNNILSSETEEVNQEHKNIIVTSAAETECSSVEIELDSLYHSEDSSDLQLFCEGRFRYSTRVFAHECCKPFLAHTNEIFLFYVWKKRDYSTIIPNHTDALHAISFNVEDIGLIESCTDVMIIHQLKDEQLFKRSLRSQPWYLLRMSTSFDHCGVETRNWTEAQLDFYRRVGLFMLRICLNNGKLLDDLLNQQRYENEAIATSSSAVQTLLCPTFQYLLDEGGKLKKLVLTYTDGQFLSNAIDKQKQIIKNPLPTVVVPTNEKVTTSIPLLVAPQSFAIFKTLPKNAKTKSANNQTNPSTPATAITDSSTADTTSSNSEPNSEPTTPSFLPQKPKPRSARTSHPAAQVSRPLRERKGTNFYRNEIFPIVFTTKTTKKSKEDKKKANNETPNSEDINMVNPIVDDARMFDHHDDYQYGAALVDRGRSHSSFGVGNIGGKESQRRDNIVTNNTGINVPDPAKVMMDELRKVLDETRHKLDVTVAQNSAALEVAELKAALEREKTLAAERERSAKAQIELLASESQRQYNESKAESAKTVANLTAANEQLVREKQETEVLTLKKQIECLTAQCERAEGMNKIENVEKVRKMAQQDTMEFIRAGAEIVSSANVQNTKTAVEHQKTILETVSNTQNTFIAQQQIQNTEINRHQRSDLQRFQLAEALREQQDEDRRKETAEALRQQREAAEVFEEERKRKREAKQFAAKQLLEQALVEESRMKKQCMEASAKVEAARTKALNDYQD